MHFFRWDITFRPIYLHFLFDILEFEISIFMNWIFFLSLNWIFAGYTSSKNPVQTRKKNPFYETGNLKLDM